MTLQELYELIDGDYGRAVQIMKIDKLISRYIQKFPKSGVNDALQEAGRSMDPVKLFESAHAMKGVCANMGLTKLADLVSTLTEEYRPGNPRTLTDEQVKAAIAEIDALYSRTVEGIHQYESTL